MSEHKSSPHYDPKLFDELLIAYESTPPGFEADSLNAKVSPLVWEEYDWPAYGQKYFEAVSEEYRRCYQDAEFIKSAGTRIFLSSQLPEELMGVLIGQIPSESIWAYLASPGKARLMAQATRGFQRTVTALRQPVVRTRIVKWLGQHPRQQFLVLALWARQKRVPAAVAALENPEKPAEELKEILPGLLHSNGVEAVLAGLAWGPRPLLFKWLQELLEVPESLAELVAEAATKVLDEQEEQQAVAAREERDTPPEKDWPVCCAEIEAQLRSVVGAGEELARANHKLQLDLDEARAQTLAVRHDGQTNVARLEKKLANLEARKKEDVEKTEHERERLARKLRAEERGLAAAQAQVRQLKKQLRQSQQILESERKKTPPTKVDSVTTPAAIPATSTRPVIVTPPTPLDEIFEWKADGRAVRVTARAIRRMIDKNSEDEVFNVMQALDSLSLDNQTLYSKFLDRLHMAGPYYERVFTRTTTAVLVDASNVVRCNTVHHGKGKLKFLYSMRDELRKRDCFPIAMYADASLPHFIDNPGELHAMMLRGEIIMADKGQEADELLAREARRTGAYVVTNDRLFFNKVSPDFEPPRISFRIYDDLLIVDEF